jgi:hypothetical protein
MVGNKTGINRKTHPPNLGDSMPQFGTLMTVFGTKSHLPNFTPVLHFLIFLHLLCTISLLFSCWFFFQGKSSMAPYPVSTHPHLLHGVAKNMKNDDHFLPCEFSTPAPLLTPPPGYRSSFHESHSTHACHCWRHGPNIYKDTKS